MPLFFQNWVVGIRLVPLVAALLAVSFSSAQSQTLEASEVLKVETFLEKQGYHPGDIDGVVDAAAILAASQFLSDNGKKGADDPVGLLAQALKKAGDKAGQTKSNALPDASTLPVVELSDATKYVSDKYGIPVLNGYLVLPSRGVAWLYEGKPNGKVLNQRWHRFFSVNAYLLKNADFEDSVELADLLLSKDQKEAIINRYSPENSGPKFFKLYLNRLNEFEREEFHDYFKGEFLSAFAQPIQGELNIVLINQAGIGAYNKETSMLATPRLGGEYRWNNDSGIINFLENFLPIKPGNDSGDRNLEFETRPYRWATEIPIPSEQARAIIEKIDRSKGSQSLSSRLAFTGSFGKIQMQSGDLPFQIDHMVFTYDANLREIIIPVTLEMLAVDEELKEKQEKERSAMLDAENKRQQLVQKENQMLAARVSFPDREFDVLGVRLWSGVEDARSSVEKQLQGYDFSITDGQGTTANVVPSNCEDGAKQLSDLLNALNANALLEGRDTLNDEERQKLRTGQESVLASIPAECAAQLMGIMQPAFRVAVNYKNGVSDRITYFQSGVPGYEGKIVAIARSLDGAEGKVDLIASLTKKYGGDMVKISGSDSFWFSTATAHNMAVEDEKFREKCIARTPWPANGASLDPDYFSLACGSYLGALGSKMYLVDTDYIVNVRELATRSAQAADKGTGEEIKF